MATRARTNGCRIAWAMRGPERCWRRRRRHQGQGRRQGRVVMDQGRRDRGRRLRLWLGRPQGQCRRGHHVSAPRRRLGEPPYWFPPASPWTKQCCWAARRRPAWGRSSTCLGSGPVTRWRFSGPEAWPQCLHGGCIRGRNAGNRHRPRGLAPRIGEQFGATMSSTRPPAMSSRRSKKSFRRASISPWRRPACRRS